MLWIRKSTRQRYPIGYWIGCGFPCRFFPRKYRLLLCHVELKDLCWWGAYHRFKPHYIEIKFKTKDLFGWLMLLDRWEQNRQKKKKNSTWKWLIKMSNQPININIKKKKLKRRCFYFAIYYKLLFIVIATVIF